MKVLKDLEISGNIILGVQATNVSHAVRADRSITASTGLIGGGDLTTNRSISVNFGSSTGTVTEGNDSRLSNARTPVAHNLMDTAGHVVSGLTSGHVLRATGATTYAFGALQATDLPNHNLVDTTRHTASGLTTGQVLRATGAATYAFQSLVAGDIPSLDMSKITSGNLETTRLSEPAFVTASITRTARPLFDVLRADRTAFLPSAQIIIERSTDAGVTWQDHQISDTNKARLFTGQRPNITLPLKNGVRNTDCMIRVTITGMRYSVPGGTSETDKYSFWNSTNIQSTERYFLAMEGWSWVNSISDRIYCRVERATGVSPNTWLLDREAFMAGWSGGNYFSLSGNTFGGGITQINNFWNWRFTFRTATTSNDFDNGKLAIDGWETISQNIHHIKISGTSVWVMPNNLMYHDHLYSWDENQNATFPASLRVNGEFSISGVRKDINWDTAFTHSQATHAPTNAQANQTITAGVGMSFTATSGDVTIAMGAPSTLTTGTSNSASSTTHTHAVTFPVTSVAGKTGVVTLIASDAGAEPTITAGTTAQYWRGDKTWQTLNATAVGLGNVTNESKATMFTSPALTGTPISTTAVVDTNTTQIATTAFVLGQASASNPAMNGTVAIGTSLRYARADHVHASDTTKANLASPALTGTPTAPTATGGTNNTQIATTAFVVNAITGAGSLVLGETDTTAYRGDRGKIAYDYSQVGHLPLIGGTLTGQTILPASTTSVSSLRIPHGTAPTSPVNGDMWTTTASLFMRINGSTQTIAHTTTWSTVSQAEAEAGTATTDRLWTAQRVKQAVDAVSPYHVGATSPTNIKLLWIDTSG